jgi:nucleoside-diphosphate-sugar epimerase
MSTLITGANGFLGKNILKAFVGSKPVTLGLSGCDINIDLSRNIPEFHGSFEKVIHAAGLAHIQSVSDQIVQKFSGVNTTGTENLLKGLEKLSPLPGIIIFISTVAVYGVDEGENIDEFFPLNGNTPYALSKIEAENLLISWGIKNGVNTLILRLPLIAGINPPGNLGSMIKAIRKGYYFCPGKGNARRSMVLASDIASFVERCKGFSGIYNLTDGYHPSVRELGEAVALHYNKRIRIIPEPLLRIAASAGDFLPFLPIDSTRLKKLTSSLTFSDQRARNEIGWLSRSVIESSDF